MKTRVFDMAINNNNIRTTEGVFYKTKPQTENVKISVYNNGVLERETQWNIKLTKTSSSFSLPSNLNRDVIITEYDAQGNIVIVEFYRSLSRFRFNEKSKSR